MKIEIKHWGTDLVFFACEADSLKDAVCKAVQSGVSLYKANLREADLREADLYEANLYKADLYEADLYEANLYEANLRGANLRGANLSGAILRGADLIDAGQDSRGYRFVGWLHNGVVQVCAGCRNFTLDESRSHWNASHKNKLALHSECLAKVDLIETVARARGWIQPEELKK